ncbi:MAG TPA: NfeD family protein [Candidatus Methanomethylophilaceae archaeon]|nr:NfeD family protein [Candidatus Methanomethylophilaceae archaeon]
MESAVVVALVLIVLGLVLLIIEATSPGVFMIIPASVLIILGALGLVSPDFLFSWWAILIAILVAVPVTAITIYFYKFLGAPQPPSTTITDTLVGTTGIVLVGTIPGSIKGKIKIGSDTWSANSDQPIEAGTKAKVLRSEGVHVFIEPVE